MTSWLNDLSTDSIIPHDQSAFRKLEEKFLFLRGEASGMLHHLPNIEQASAHIQLLAQEASTSSKIEGLVIDPSAIHRALLRRPGRTSFNTRMDKAQPIGELIAAVTTNFDATLTRKTLTEWHRLAVPELPANAPTYRTVPTDHISSPSTPSPSHISGELFKFCRWFNRSREAMPLLTRAGIAYIRLEAIRPFQCANGAISRAVAQRVFAQAHNRAPPPMFAEAVAANPDLFTNAIEAALAGGSLRDWLENFARFALAAQERTIQRLRFDIARQRSQGMASAHLNSRQIQALTHMFNAGPDGFPNGLSAADYRSLTCSSVPTTTRDLNGLVTSGFVRRASERRYARYHLIT